MRISLYVRDPKVWEEFKVKCKSLGVSASQVLFHFMKAFIENRDTALIPQIKIDKVVFDENVPEIIKQVHKLKLDFFKEALRRGGLIRDEFTKEVEFAEDEGGPTISSLNLLMEYVESYIKKNWRIMDPEIAKEFIQLLKDIRAKLDECKYPIEDEEEEDEIEEEEIIDEEDKQEEKYERSLVGILLRGRRNPLS